MWGELFKRLFLATGPGKRLAESNRAVDRVNDLLVERLGRDAQSTDTPPGRRVRLDSSSSSDDDLAWDNIAAVTFTTRDGSFVATSWTGPPFHTEVYVAYWVEGDTVRALNAFASEVTPDVASVPETVWNRHDVQRAIRRMHRKGLKV